MTLNSIARRGAAFITFGLPFLLGYGVLPLPNFINEVAALMGFGLLLMVARQISAPFRVSRPYAFLACALLVLFSHTVVQALLSKVPGSGELYAYTAGYLLLGGFAFHLGSQIGASNRDALEWMLIIAWVIVLAGLGAAAAGLIQYFRISHPLGFIPYLPTAGRAFGFVRQPNHQATFVVIAIQALAFLHARGRVPRWAAWLAGTVLVAGLLATGSRMGVGVLVLILLWILLSQGGRMLAFVGVMAASAVCVVALFLWLHVHADVPFYGVAKINQSLNEGAGVRTTMWVETLRMIAASPWLGGGLLHYGQVFLLSDAAIKSNVVMGNAHNLFLQLAFDYGVPATALVAVALAYCLWAARAVWRDPVRACALGIVGCIGVHSMLEFPLWYTHYLIMGLFMLGMATSHSAVSTSAPGSSVAAPAELTTGGARLHEAVLAAAGLVTVVVGMWMNHDFYKVSPLFRGVADTPVEKAIADAQGVTWFRRYVRYAELAIQPVTAANAATYWIGMENLSCLMLDPLYQTTLVAALGYQGRLEEAERLLYIYWRLGNKDVDNLKKYLAQHQGPAFDRLRDYLDHPTPVQVEPGRILRCLR